MLKKIWTSRVTIRITRFVIYSTYIWRLIYVNSRRNGCYLNWSNLVFQNRELFRISREFQYPASLFCSFTEDFSKYDRNIKNWPHRIILPLRWFIMPAYSSAVYLNIIARSKYIDARAQRHNVCGSDVHQRHVSFVTRHVARHVSVRVTRYTREKNTCTERVDPSQ